MTWNEAITVRIYVAIIQEKFFLNSDDSFYIDFLQGIHLSKNFCNTTMAFWGQVQIACSHTNPAWRSVEICTHERANSTGKSLSEALIFASTNPQYDKRLFMELPWNLQGQNMLCTCSFHGNFMNNLLSYCNLIDAKIRASDKGLPVRFSQKVPEKCWNIKFT